MALHGDENGMFWNVEVRPVKTGNRVAAEPRTYARPPVPETGWKRPEYFPSLSSAKRICVDVESHDPYLTTKGPGFQRGDASVVGVAIGTDDGYRAYYPVDHADSDNFPREQVMQWLNAELGRPAQEKVGANLYYDFEALQKEGVRIAGRPRDVQIAEPLLDEARFEYNLESLSQSYLGEGKNQDAMIKWQMQAFGCDAQQAKSHMRATPATLVGPYAESDVDRPLRILPLQEAELAKQGMSALFDMECDLLYPLLRMKQTGVRIDEARVPELNDMFQKRFDKCIADLDGINVDETAALVKLFEKNGLDYPRTPKGNPSFRKNWLEHHTHPVAKKIVAARKYRVMLSTFDLTAHAVNGRIHSQFNASKGDKYGTVTGRFSSSNPNLQNIPIRDEELGPVLRSMFIPEHGMLWGTADYSQVEYRGIVHFASMYGCEGAAKAVAQYNQDHTTDFHEYVAELCGVSRKVAKNINFGMAYGQGVETLADALGVTPVEARRILTQYHESAPFVGELMQDCIRDASNNGYITTLFNRRRRYTMFEKKGVRASSNYKENIEYKLLPYQAAVHAWGKGNIQRAKTYTAVNAKVQGSAADIMKKAMVDMWNEGLFDIMPVHLTVHDELDVSVPQTTVGNEAFKRMLYIMEHCVKLRVPLLVEGGTGKNWAEAK